MVWSTVYSVCLCIVLTFTHAERTKEISTGFGLLFTKLCAFTFHVEVKSLCQRMIPFGPQCVRHTYNNIEDMRLADRNIVGKWMPHTTEYFCCHRRCRSRKCGDDRQFYRKVFIRHFRGESRHCRSMCARVISTTHHTVQPMLICTRMCATFVEIMKRKKRKTQNQRIRFIKIWTSRETISDWNAKPSKSISHIWSSGKYRFNFFLQHTRYWFAHFHISVSLFSSSSSLSTCEANWCQ